MAVLADPASHPAGPGRPKPRWARPTRPDAPHGPCWRRYNHDGYGQREDGLEIWRFNRQVRTAGGGRGCVFQGPRPFYCTGRRTIGIIATTRCRNPPCSASSMPIFDCRWTPALRLTFLWPDTNRWEGKDHSIGLRARSEEENSLGKAAYGEFAKQVA